MSDRSLRDAITTVVNRELARVSDRILRLEVSKDWPVADALVDLDKITRVRVLVQRPFKSAQFSGPRTTENAGTATAWRNDKGRNYAVVILGTGTGNLDAGLKDVRPLRRKEVVEEWKKRVVEKIGAKGALAKYEVQELLSELFSRVANGELPASKLQDYLGAIAVTPSVDGICSNLWRLDLIPDNQAIDRSMAGVRLSRNQELVYRIRASDDAKIDSRLETAAELPKQFQLSQKQQLHFVNLAQSKIFKIFAYPSLKKF
jgi:hypothetical protein